MNKGLYKALVCAVGLLSGSFIFGQDKRTQDPAVLRNSYFGVNIGYIGYNFTQQQLEQGYAAASIHIPHTAVQIVLGHRFNKYISAELTYSRPVGFVEYRDINGSGHNYEVGMNITGLTINPSLPVSKKITIEAKAGIAIITRGGFIVIDAPGVKDAMYASVLLGGGMAYHLNNKWELTLNGSWAPANDDVMQPATNFYSAGFKYTMRQLPGETVQRNAATGFIFPKHLLQVGYSTNVAGYGVNHFVSKDAHIFWGGAAKVKNGISFNYQRNIFHTKKVFSLDWGAGLAYWQSNMNQQKFLTVSIYPVFRFSFLRTKMTDLYFNYSFAGPSFISKTTIDGFDTGRKFTFQDFMGLGLFAGKKRNVNAELRIAHYSNGNIFPQNNGVMVPLTIAAGYSF